MFVLDTVKKEPELEESSIRGARQSSPTTAHAENSKEPNIRKMNENIIASDLEIPDDLTTNSSTSPNCKPNISPSKESKVELRMDEITSKFKNAFERMAELESLQLSMEQDADDAVIRSGKWQHKRHKNSELCDTLKKGKDFPAQLDKDVTLKSLSSVGGVIGNMVVTTKKERLSPDTEGRLETKDFGSHNEEEEELRHEEGNEERTGSGSGGGGGGGGGGFPQEWSYEEQFKKLYEFGEEPDRKEFLDKLFAFMQNRGTPVNRVPIMAKQTLDLYKLFKLVVERGGLVEVINKKIWRGIIKGLNLPSSVTSAAFTLRTQYMKYLYPYECSTLKLSSPSELQCAIDGNRRDTTRRPSIGHYTSMVEPEGGFYSNSTSPKSNCSSPTLKRASSPTVSYPVARRLSAQNEFASPSFHGNNGIGFNAAIQRIMAASSSDSRSFISDTRSTSPSYIQDRCLYEPPYKKKARSDDHEKRKTFAQIPWANIKIRTTGRDIPGLHENGDELTQENKEESPSISVGKSPKQPSATSLDQVDDNSIVVSIELNGLRYQGVLYAQQR